MKHTGHPLVERYCVTSCGVLRQHHHAARPLIARSSIPRSRRHCRKTVAVVDESSDLAAAELAHRLRSFSQGSPRQRQADGWSAAIRVRACLPCIAELDSVNQIGRLCEVMMRKRHTSLVPDALLC